MTMNHEEYEKLVLADPHTEEGGEHLASSPESQQFRQEVIDLDRQIERALSISVPELKMPELPDIDTSNVASIAPKRRLTAPAWLAVAATVTIAAFIGFRLDGPDLSDATLAEQILDHLDHEKGSMVVSDRPVSDARLARVVPARIANMDHSAGLITYAQSCKINGVEVPHLVIQGERGPVTILLMPGQAVDGPEAIEGDAINGVILPVGDGSIAIIGEEGERLDLIEDKVKNSVTWTT